MYLYVHFTKSESPYSGVSEPTGYLHQWRLLTREPCRAGMVFEPQHYVYSNALYYYTNQK